MVGKGGKALLAARTMAAKSAEKDNGEKAAVSFSSRVGLQSLAAWPLYPPTVGGGLPSVRSSLFLRGGGTFFLLGGVVLCIGGCAEALLGA
ncbi:hypothetical protein GUJ93_ZPchr0002g23739 [Zizania palustris]|uniref:Uncharacterized protein n=1 Tax=Zizania palustris TaxID=103762 RepID=A0A8J5RXW7_ZIZPA|nr:hypothetical protein GUJ93_ZPchr0002g23739 [Zizania palustris]